jgi:hypothetical protein
MSKIKETIEEEVYDDYKEHELHNTYNKNCSICFSLRLEDADVCGLVYTGDLDLKGYPEFIGTQDQWEAFKKLTNKKYGKI